MRTYPLSHSENRHQSINWPFIESSSSNHNSEINVSKIHHARQIVEFFSMMNIQFPPEIHGASLMMMLDIYMSEARGRRVSVGDACIAAGVPQTTGLRYLERLLDNDFIVRHPDDSDSRRKLLELTPRSHALIEGFLDKAAEFARANRLA